MGSETSRSDGIANILTTAGSEVDGQPYCKVGLPTLKVIWTFSKQAEGINGDGGVDMKSGSKATRSQGRGRRGATGDVYRGRMHRVGKLNLDLSLSI